MDYYTTFDVEERQVSFTILENGQRSRPVEGTVPTDEMPKGVSLVKHRPIHLMTVPFGVGGFTVGYYVTWRIYRYYVIGDDKFWVLPWTNALMGTENALSFFDI